MKITRENMTKDDLIKLGQNDHKTKSASTEAVKKIYARASKQAVKEYFDQKRIERSKPKKQGFFAKIFGGSKK